MRVFGLIVLVSGTLAAQNSGMTARQLYLQEEPAAPKTQDKGASKQVAQKTPDAPKQMKQKGPAPSEAPKVSTTPVAAHLGLRYNLLKVDATTKESHEVVPDMNFKNGDCIAVRIKPNRGGSLYVFNLGTSGAWQPLLPSPAMADERNTVQAGTEVTVPEKYCFQIDDPRGTETLMVVMTEKPEDFLKLNDAIRKTAGGGAGQAQPTSRPASPGIEPAVIASYRASESKGLKTEMVSRDLSPKKVGEATEPPNSVYVVNTANTKDDRIVIEVKIRHE